MRVEDGLLGGDQLAYQRREHRGQVGAPRFRRLRSHCAMIGIALSYACAYCMCMPTIETSVRALHRAAVLRSIELVDTVTSADLGRPTPCQGWNLADLLAHMTVQHRGFTAAARGFGADPDVWRVESVVDAVKADHVRVYADAAHDVIDAFGAAGTLESQFELPEFGADAVFPAE